MSSVSRYIVMLSLYAYLNFKMYVLALSIKTQSSLIYTSLPSLNQITGKQVKRKREYHHIMLFSFPFYVQRVLGVA